MYSQHIGCHSVGDEGPENEEHAIKNWGASMLTYESAA